MVKEADLLTQGGAQVLTSDVASEVETDVGKERRVDVSACEPSDANVNKVEPGHRMLVLSFSEKGAQQATNAYLDTISIKLSGVPLPVVKSLRILIKSPKTRFTMAKATPDPIAAAMPMDSSR